MIDVKAKAWINLEFEIEIETQLEDGVESCDVDSSVLEQLRQSIRKCDLTLPNLKLEYCQLVNEDYDLKEVTLSGSSSYDADDKADDERMERKIEERMR